MADLEIVSQRKNERKKREKEVINYEESSMTSLILYGLLDEDVQYPC